MRKQREKPTMEELECLISWPKDSKGYRQEHETLKTYLDLCEINGYGRMSQIAEQVQTIWEDPATIEQYQEEKIKRFKFLDWKL